jgi:hypothetical protein
MAVIQYYTDTKYSSIAKALYICKLSAQTNLTLIIT